MSLERADFAEQRDDLLQSIEKDRQNVRVAVLELTSAADLQWNLGERVRAFPLAWTVGAFLVGAWLGNRAASVDGRGPRRPE